MKVTIKNLKNNHSFNTIIFFQFEFRIDMRPILGRNHLGYLFYKHATSSAGRSNYKIGNCVKLTINGFEKHTNHSSIFLPILQIRLILN